VKTLTPALETALAADVQKPAWLVSIAFSSTVYLSSYANVDFDSHTWLAADIDVGRIKLDGLAVSGSLTIGNADDAFASAVLNEGVAGRQIRIYGYDAAATATADIIMLAQCVGGKATVDASRVTIALREAFYSMHTPRQFVRAPTFNALLPSGSSFTINGQTYKIERSQAR